MNSEICTICGDADTKACAVCKTTYYCSAKCQKLDWPLHKQHCQKMVNFLKHNSRPLAQSSSSKKSEYKLAMLMPFDKDVASFVWVKIEKSSSAGGVEQYPNNIENAVQKHLGGRETEKNAIVRFGRTVYMHYRKDHLDLAENHVLICLNEGYGNNLGRLYDHENYYCGNILLTSMGGKKLSDKRHAATEAYTDITLADFRNAFNMMTRYNNTYEIKFKNKNVIRDNNVWTKAVRVSCFGERVICGRAIQEVLVKHKAIDSNQKDDNLDHAYRDYETMIHSIYKAMISPISNALGMDIHVQMIPLSQIQCQSRGFLSIELCHAFKPIAELMSVADPRHAKYGLPASDIWNTSHSVIVARMDKTELSKHHVAALMAYCNTVQTNMAALRAPEVSLAQRLQANSATLKPENFADFFVSYKGKAIAAGSSDWKDSETPICKFRGQQPLDHQEDYDALAKEEVRFQALREKTRRIVRAKFGGRSDVVFVDDL